MSGLLVLLAVLLTSGGYVLASQGLGGAALAVSGAIAGLLLLVAAFIARPAFLLFMHLSSRWLIDSAPEITYVPSIAGLSISQAYTLTWVGVFAAYLATKNALRFDWLTVLIALMPIAAVLPASYHGEWATFAATQSRWVYLWLLILVVRLAAERQGARSVAMAVALAGIYPMLNVITYGLVGPAQIDHGAVRVLYGTFNHQSDTAAMAWTVIPCALFLCITDSRAVAKFAWFGLFLLACVLLIGTGYRSFWIGLAIYLALACVSSLRMLGVGGRAALLGSAVALSAGVVLAFGDLLFERMEDIVKFAVNPSEYFRLDHFDRNNLMSGRVDIINASLIEYSQAPLIERVLGLGPGSIEWAVWTHLGAVTYAHNEYVSALVENGLFGLLLFVFMLAAVSLRVGLRLVDDDWLPRIFAPVWFAVVVVALATMPFRDTRMLVLVAISVGLAFYFRSPRRPRWAPAMAHPGLAAPIPATPAGRMHMTR